MLRYWYLKITSLFQACRLFHTTFLFSSHENLHLLILEHVECSNYVVYLQKDPQGYFWRKTYILNWSTIFNIISQWRNTIPTISECSCINIQLQEFDATAQKIHLMDAKLIIYQVYYQNEQIKSSNYD